MEECCCDRGECDCELCCQCGRALVALDDFDADELGLDPEEKYDA